MLLLDVPGVLFEFFGSVGRIVAVQVAEGLHGRFLWPWFTHRRDGHSVVRVVYCCNDGAVSLIHVSLRTDVIACAFPHQLEDVTNNL